MGLWETWVHWDLASGYQASSLRIRAGAFASLTSTLFLQVLPGIPASTRSERSNSCVHLNRLLLFPFVKFAWISVIWALRPCLVRLQELQLPIYPYLPCRGLCGCSGWWGGGQCVLSCSLTDASPPLTTLGKFCYLQRSAIFHATCSLKPSRLCPVLSTSSFPLG